MTPGAGYHRRVGTRDRYAAVAEVSFHLGELYFLMPFLSGIDYAPGERICLLFTSRSLYEEFRRDAVLVEAVESAPIDVERAFIRKGVPRRPRPLPLDVVVEIWRAVKRQVLRQRVLRLLGRTDIYLAQVVGGMTEAILRRRDRLPARVLRFPHTSSAQIMDVEQARKQVFRQLAPGDTMLVVDPDAIPYYELYGARRFVVLGYHSLAERWLSLLGRHAGPPRHHAVIFSFAARDDMLPLDKWEYLHRTTYQAIRERFGDIPILIKPHPNQNAQALVAFIAAEGWTGARVVTDHPMLVATDARFAVGFLTGGIYNSMMLDIPSINYYNARDDYTRAHGSFMQDLEAVGAADARDEQQLRVQLARVADGELTCDFGTRKRGIPLIASWSEFRSQLDG
jgi:hypothetical protein